MTLTDWASPATIVGVVIAVFVLFYTAVQVRQNTMISRGQFWLTLEEMFRYHDDVHMKLRPGGEWSTAGTGPKTPTEWAKLENYMGLFEHCEALLRRGLIDHETFERIFAYRLRNLVANDMIVADKLTKEKASWTSFLSLLDRLRIMVPRRAA